jgi:hypothetical protein
MSPRGSILILLMLLAGSCAASAGGPAPLAHRPLIITRGGAYAGQFSSADARIPAVLVRTAEPVIIENSTITGRGNLIAAGVHHINLTVRNTRAIGLNPNVAGRCAGRFVTVDDFDNLIIEHCELISTAGIYALDYAGDRTPANTVRIVANHAINIDGRQSDGKGGYRPGQAHDLVQFAQLDKVRHVPGIEIAWNEVTNEPIVSRVEDNINIYLSSGTSGSPIRIHDNFIRGAYPAALKSGALSADYSGGGIMLGDGAADEPQGDPAFVDACDNQVLDTVNYGIAIAAGHDNRIDRNRVFSAGVLESGQRIAAQNVGIYVWDMYKTGRTRFYNNSGSGNVIGWMKGTGRNDSWTPDVTAWKGNQSAPAGTISRQVYDQERALWVKKCAAAGVKPGLQNPSQR